MSLILRDWMRSVGERWCNRGIPRLLPFKMNKRMFVITQTTAVWKYFSCLLFILCPYLPSTPGPEVFQWGFLRILFSGTLHRVPHRTSTSYSRTEFVLYKMSTSGRISPAAFIGCDGSRYLTPLQRSACDYAEVSLLLPYVMASPNMPYGFRDCGCS